ncbi:MAG: hypothetical protein LBC39_08795 [Methanobrevibacter sp.]|jgi:hypothetical protein|nr:hypothetical protein [Candidatus Methanovirga aequatorialis]
MYKLDYETKISSIDESKIIITRGYWNSTQTTINVDMKADGKKQIEIFKHLQKYEKIDDSVIDDSLKKEFEELINTKLIIQDFKKKSEGTGRCLFITDMPNYLSNKFKDYRNIIYYSTKNFRHDFFNNLKLEDVLHDPLLGNKIKNKVEHYVSDNSIDIICVILLKTNNSFCSILNYVYKEKIIFLFFDNSFIYLLGIKWKYTGCYSCFSKGMEARCNHDLKDEEHNENASESEMIFGKEYLLNFALGIFEHNFLEYISNERVPLFGKLCSIFIPTLEVRYENLLRSTFCSECGAIALMQNKERNFNLRNFFKNCLE